MYKITMTVPVYNAGKYLSDLMESLINQTMDFKEIQVIMVDDCSTDNSREIMKKYSDKYENIESIFLEENSGVAGKARNEGMKLAKGKYLMFADADDFLTKDACEMMYKNMEEKNADFITANYINADEDGTVWNVPIFSYEKYKDFKLSITDYDKSFFIMNSSACNKIFRREFVEKHNIKFLEGVPGEDAYFTTSCFMKAKTVYYVSKVMYCYRQRNKTAGTKSVSFNCSRDYFSRINRSYRAIYENFRDNGFISFYRYVYAKNMSYMLYKFIDSTLLSDDERVDILKEMKWFYELSVELKVPACQMAQTMIIKKILEDNYGEAINYCKVVADIRKYLPKEIRESMSRPDSDMYKEIGKFDSEYEN